MALSCERIERCDRGNESPSGKEHRSTIGHPQIEGALPSDRIVGLVESLLGGLSPKPMQFANQQPGGIEFRGRARPGECAMRATGLQREADRRRRIRTEIVKQRSDSIGGHESLGRLGSQNYIVNDLFARHVARRRPQESGLVRANCCIAMLQRRGGKMNPNRSMLLKDRFNRPIGIC